MPFKRRRVAEVKKGHIKYVSVTARTIERYKVGCRRFYAWMAREGLSMPNSFEELDFVAGEYVNCFYVDDYPLGWITDFISGMKRLFPRCKRKLETATSYMRNWQKATVRVRALPLSADLVCGMAAVAFRKQQPELGLALVLGFAGLLRAGEIVNLRLQDVTILRPGLAVLAFADSKGAQRKGQPESVFSTDAKLVEALRRRKDSEADEAYVYSGSYRDLGSSIRTLASFFGLAHPNLTPHCLRRGGATWHFTRHLSYDSTQRHGRWVHARTAQCYIDEAMAEMGSASLPQHGRRRLEAAVHVLPSLF